MLSPDPWRALDAQPNVAALIAGLEARGGTPTQARLRRRFLRFVPVRSGARVLEVGCGTGVVVRDLAAMVGPPGRGGRRRHAAARCWPRPAVCAGPRAGRARIALRVADGARLPFAADRFDATLAITVILHVADPLAVVREMARVTRPGGRVGLQDQDFGMVAVTHPDPRADRSDPATAWWSTSTRSRTAAAGCPGLLRAAGLDRRAAAAPTSIRTRRSSRGRRRSWSGAPSTPCASASSTPPTAQRWLDGFTALVAAGAFVFTMNYYGAVGVKPR